MELKPFEHKIWLASPTMHGEEQQFVNEAIETNWVSTVGANINALEDLTAARCGCKYAVALSCGTSALHLAMRLTGEQLYGASPYGTLRGKKVFCTDMTFDASVNPVVYEGGEPVFIDSEYETWNMDPEALERAFEMYPDVKLVVLAHLYGTPAKMDELLSVCERHGALIIEDAAEALGASYKGRPCGSLGSFNAISFNGNKIVTGSAGGMFLTDSKHDAEKVRKWSTQSREAAPWYQHEELGYNYRMSNIVAGVARGNFLHLDEHIAQKKAVYERYRDGLQDLPVRMNPYLGQIMEPNFWLSCLILDEGAMAPQVRGECDALYRTAPGKTCPTEILETLAKYNAEGRPIWKPMHMQPIYRMNPFFTAAGSARAQTNAYIAGGCAVADEDIFRRGLCLPSDNKMTPEEQDVIIEIIRRCFD